MQLPISSLDSPESSIHQAGHSGIRNRKFLFRKSITPASLIAVVQIPGSRRWLACRGGIPWGNRCGDIAMITSGRDYHCAAGKKSAFTIKIEIGG